MEHGMICPYCAWISLVPDSVVALPKIQYPMPFCMDHQHSTDETCDPAILHACPALDGKLLPLSLTTAQMVLTRGSKS